jgi:hypothetical protein
VFLLDFNFCSPLPQEPSEGGKFYLRTRPTDWDRVKRLADDKVESGYLLFHGAGVVFDPNETDKTKLAAKIEKIAAGNGNPLVDCLYVVAENHNILSSLQAYKRLSDAKDPTAANFSHFDVYVCAYPKKEDGMGDEAFHQLCGKVFRDVRFDSCCVISLQYGWSLALC